MSSSQNKHLSDRLIRTIESNAEELTAGTVKKLQSSPRTETYHKVSHNDLHNRGYEIYHNLGLWLWEKS
jgi:primosomal protein N''